MFKSVLLSALLLVSTASYANQMNLFVKEVMDGDTFSVIVTELPHPLNLMKVRIKGIDAPELKSNKCGMEKQKAMVAKQQLKMILDSSENYVVVKNPKWDKYGGRIVGDVYTSDKKSVAQMMLQKGNVEVWSGVGPKPVWCK
jgi:endonuclease YncB( thermonuclease family)